MPAHNTKKSKDKYKATAWATEPTIDLEVPSGQLCLVRRPGVTGLIRAGILDSLDSLTGMVQTEHIDRVEREKSGKTITPEDIASLQNNKERLTEALDLMDKVLTHVVIEPRLYLPFEYDEEAGKYILMARLDKQTGAQQVIDGVPATDMVPIADDNRVPGRAYTDMIDVVDKVFIFQFVVGGVSDLETFRKEFEGSLAGLETVTGVPRAAE